jgi:large-conductance mechanosensitive channel
MSAPARVAALVLKKQDPQLSGILGSDVNSTSSITALSDLNQATVYTKSICQTNCTQLTENITVIVSPGAFVGPVSFTQRCEVSDVQCAIDTLVDSGIKSSMENIKTKNYDVKLADGALFGIDKRVLRSHKSIDEQIRNNVFQMISSACLFETNQVISNNYVYVGTGAKTGAISFAQSSQISSVDCVIDTVAKNNSIQTDNTEPSGLMLGLVITAIIIFVVIAIIFTIVIIVTNSNKKRNTLFRGNRPSNLDKKIYIQASKQVQPSFYGQDTSFR